jgi:hypothetical protein
METVPRRDICVQNHWVNVYNPVELLGTNIKNLPKSKFNRFYKVEEIKIDKRCPTGQSYKILFLQDIVDNLPLNSNTYLEAKEYFPKVSKEYILSTWSQKINIQDDWDSLKRSGIIFSSQDRQYFKNIKPVELVNEGWLEAKDKLYQIKPFEADNFNITSLELEIVLKNRTEKKLDPLEIFDSMKVSVKLPYVYCLGNTKELSNSIYTPENNSNFCCTLCLSSLPVIKPKLEIIFRSEREWGALDLVVKPLEWMNQTIDNIKGFLTKNNISHEPNLETLLKEIEIWKNYLSSFSNIKIEVRNSYIILRTELNPENDFSGTFSKNIVQKLFGNRYEIQRNSPGTVNVDFRYPNIALDSNIFFYIIRQHPVLCHLLLPMEDKKLGLIHREKNKFRGSFRILAKVHDETIKATFNQNPGNKRSDGIPFLSVSIKGAKTIYSVYSFARLFGIALALYEKEKGKVVVHFKKYVNKYPKLPRIKTDKSNCNANKDCGKTICNPVTKKCSPNISTTKWWAENYSRKCQPVIPWVVDKDSVEDLRQLGYHVDEFPKNSGEFLTCPKISKGKKTYDNFYLISNSLSNQKKYPFLPCCGADDRRIQAGALYNKYYGNLENLDLNNGTRVEMTLENFKSGMLDKLLDFSKDKLTIIGFDPVTKRFLSSKNLKLTEDQVKKILDIPKDPLGAVLISNKGGDIMVTVFAEIDIIRAERDLFSKDIGEFDPLTIGLNQLIVILGASNSSKFFIDRLKRNEDLNTQKRATIGRSGKLPTNIHRLLNLVSLNFDSPDTWRRRGVTRDSSASFLHILYCVQNDNEISRNSSFAVRRQFLKDIDNRGRNISLALCKQSMTNFSEVEILKKLDPNNEDYVDPREIHALAQYIFNMNIILLQRSTDSEDAEFVLPYYNEMYLTSSHIYKKTVVIYEHFGADAEKFFKTPHCELVEGNITEEIGEYLLRSWLFNIKTFSGNDLILPIDIPNSFIENGWSQVINDSGHGIKLVKDGISILTSNLPPLPIPMVEDMEYNPSDGEIEFFLDSNNLVLTSQNDNDIFSEYLGVVDGTTFDFKIITWNSDNSLLELYIRNRKIAKCVVGYFNFALSTYLNNIKFSTKMLQEKLKPHEHEMDQTTLLDCIYDSLIDSFINKHVSNEFWDNMIEFSEMLPPPRSIYRSGRLYLNTPIVSNNGKSDVVLFRLKLQAKLLMKYNLDMILDYKDNQSIPEYFQLKEDFTKRPNELITTPGNSFTINDPKIVYTHILMNQDKDYMWRNKILTNNKICISRTFDATDPLAQNKINDWLYKFRIDDAEEIEIITIQKPTDPGDFKILSPSQPILIVINDGILPLFVPVIEYTK